MHLIIKYIGIKGLFLALVTIWACIASIQAHNNKKTIISLQQAIQARDAQIKSQQITISQNAKDYEVMDKACFAQIKEQVEKAIKLQPVCPDGAKPVYKVKDMVK